MSRPDVFLSYSREDQAMARRVAEGLQRAGFRVWWDQSLNAGETFDEVTEKALDEARAVVVLWSPRSVVSRWVRAEATQADDNGTLLPVLIEPCNLPIKFKLTQAAPLTRWHGSDDDPAWQAFVAGLRRFIEHSPAGAGVADAPPPTASATPAPARSTTGTPQPAGWRNRRVGLAAAALLALLVAGIWFAFNRGTPSGTPIARGAAQGPVTIAVLPFEDMSPAKDQEFLADGLSEEILNSLARIGGNLQVTGRTSSFHFKGRNEELRTIGEKLGVAYLLEGSVRKQGEQLRITAQLVKAADGFHLWSRTYDRPAQDVFRIQEEIARAVADTLQVALGVGVLGQLPGMTRDIQAYEAWLEARAHASKLTLEGYRLATERLEFAIQKDPGFLGAWANAWGAYSNMTLFAEDAALAAASRARAVQLREEVQRRFGGTPAGDFFLSSTAFSGEEWISHAQRVIQTAVSPPPEVPPTGQSDLRLEADAFHLRLDKASRALPGLQEARLRDPLNPSVLVFLPEAYANTGRISEALEEQDRAWEAAPSPLIAANSLITALAAGDMQRARGRWERLRETQQNPITLDLYNARENPVAQRARLRLAFERGEPIPASQLSIWAALFGDPELALEVLRRDTDGARRSISVMALWRPAMRDVRRLPDFKQLVRDWGLVDYWKQHGWGDHCRPLPGDDFECS